MAGKNSIDFTKLIELGKKVGAILAALAIFNSIAVWYITNTEAYRDFEELLEFKKKAMNEIIPNSDTTDRRHTKQIHHLHKWQEEKDKMFRVGLSVDQNNRLWYKDREGNLYTAYYLASYQAFYYVDKDGFEKECH